MSKSKRTRRLSKAFATLLLCVLSPGCEGFFVDPVLTGLTVGPTAGIQTGKTIQMSAVGSYNDGSQKTVTSSVHWSSGTPSVATISSSGLVTGFDPGQSIITGALGTVSGTATITVTVGGLTSIRVSNQDGVTNIAYGASEQFIATGTANGEQVTITDSVTWSTSPALIPNVSINPGTGLLTTTSGLTKAVQFQVIATDPTTNISGRMNFTVHQ